MNRVLAVVCALVVPSFAHAGTVVFSDNFDANAGAANAAPGGWTVTSGTVDIYRGSWYSFSDMRCETNDGACIDLDGSTMKAGILSTSLNLTAGITYNAYFDLSGSQRYYAPSNSDTVTITFGGSTESVTLNYSDPWATHEISFTPTSSGTYSLSFYDASWDNRGAGLDNVVVEAIPPAPPVPEPETYAMMLAGLGLLGAVARRRKV